MPGSSGDYKRILKALKSGSLSRQQLIENASTVIRMASKLKEEKEHIK